MSGHTAAYVADSENASMVRHKYSGRTVRAYADAANGKRARACLT